MVTRCCSLLRRWLRSSTPVPSGRLGIYKILSFQFISDSTTLIKIINFLIRFWLIFHNIFLSITRSSRCFPYHQHFIKCFLRSCGLDLINLNISDGVQFGNIYSRNRLRSSTSLNTIKKLIRWVHYRNTVSTVFLHKFSPVSAKWLLSENRMTSVIR